MNRYADALRQRWQNARARLDKGDVHVLGLDAVQAIGRQLVGSVVQLGRQLYTGGTGADNGYADFLAGHVAACGHAGSG